MKTLDNITAEDKAAMVELAASGLNKDEIIKKSKIQAGVFYALERADPDFKAALTGARRIHLHSIVKEYFNALKKMGELAFSRRDKALISGIDRYIARLQWIVERAWPELFMLPTPEQHVHELAAMAGESLTQEQEQRMVADISVRLARMNKMELEEKEAESESD